jgi:hypothetical protein
MTKAFGKLAMVVIATVVLSSSYSHAGILDQVLFGAKAAPKYDPLPPATIYTKDEFETLANGPKLVVLVNQYHQSASKNDDEIIENYRKKAGKSGAEGLYVLKTRTISATSTFSKLKHKEQQVEAESFRLEEPNLDKIRFILEKRAETFADKVKASDVYIKSIMNQIVAQKYTDIGDYILKLIIESPQYMSHEKIIMLDGYKALLGDKALDGIKRVKNDRNMEPDIKAHALAMLTVDGVTGGNSSNNNGNDKLYKLIVTSNNATAARLIFDYTKNATPEDTNKLRKLLKNHPSEVVRVEAGKALVRLHDADFVENALQAERSEKVVTDIKKEMLLQ